MLIVGVVRHWQPSSDELQALTEAPLTVPTLAPWLDGGVSCPWCGLMVDLDCLVEDDECGQDFHVCADCFHLAELKGW